MKCLAPWESPKSKRDGYITLITLYLGVFYHPLVKTCHGQFVYQIWSALRHPFQSYGGAQNLKKVIINDPIESNSKVGLIDYLSSNSNCNQLQIWENRDLIWVS